MNHARLRSCPDLSQPHPRGDPSTVTAFTPTDVARQLGSGLLSFPVTHFAADLRSTRRRTGRTSPGCRGYDAVRPVRRRRHRGVLLPHPRRGRAGRGGRGEGDPGRAAGHRSGRLRHGAWPSSWRSPPSGPAPTASCCCRTTCPRPASAGLEAHVRAVCRSTELGVIIYNRANARYDADTVERPRRRLPEPDRLQGRRRRHRADDPDLLPAGRPAAVRRRPAHGRDVRAAVPEAGSDHLLVGDLQLPARAGRWTSTPRSAAATTPTSSPR